MVSVTLESKALIVLLFFLNSFQVSLSTKQPESTQCVPFQPRVDFLPCIIKMTSPSGSESRFALEDYSKKMEDLSCVLQM